MDENENGQRRFGAKGSYLRVIVTSLGLGLAMLCVLLVRALFEQGRVSGALLGGMVIPVSIGVTLFFLLIGLVGRSGFHRSAVDDAPRDPSGKIVGVMVAVPLAIGSAIVINSYLDDSKFLRTAVPAQARVLSISESECSRVGCFVEVGYSFTPQDRDQPITGYLKVFSSRSRVRSEEYKYVSDTGTIPIMYDRNNPETVRFSWKDEIAERSSVQGLIRHLAVWGLIVFGGLSPIIVGVWVTKRKQARARSSAPVEK